VTTEGKYNSKALNDTNKNIRSNYAILKTIKKLKVI
jgi:hypothetical protein